MSDNFGSRLKMCRVASNLTQFELAEKSGVSRKQISDFEMGIQINPRSATIHKLAAALNVSPSFLLHGVKNESIERETAYDRPITTASKLYISSSLKQKIEDATKESGRSINAEAVYRLEKSFEKPATTEHEVSDLRELLKQSTEANKAYFQMIVDLLNKKGNPEK